MTKGKFLFPVRAMSNVFRAKYVPILKSKVSDIDKKLLDSLFKKEFVLYAKRLIHNTHSVIEYLGRYTHKIAISNHRIQSIEFGKVSFTYKDYAHGGVQKIMTLECIEFLRRFCMHILPPQFTKIRHYGILSSRNKAKLSFIQFRLGVNVAIIEKSNWKQIYIEKYHLDPDSCPCCKTGKMFRILSFRSIPPPMANQPILQNNAQ
ncbi:MAG TPA: transposase [Saprospiraceae bacterium]|nr:transposase [Saprospiraceae bacterium]